jgi:hypothetical protein
MRDPAAFAAHSTEATDAPLLVGPGDPQPRTCGSRVWSERAGQSAAWPALVTPWVGLGWVRAQERTADPHR